MPVDGKVNFYSVAIFNWFRLEMFQLSNSAGVDCWLLLRTGQ